MGTKVQEDTTTDETKSSCTTITLSERQLCLLDAAHLRTQCERMTTPTDSAEDRLACPLRREMARLLKISAEM